MARLFFWFGVMSVVLILCLINFFRFKYKDEYEKFKLILSVIGFVLSVINILTNVR